MTGMNRKCSYYLFYEEVVSGANVNSSIICQPIINRHEAPLHSLKTSMEHAKLDRYHFKCTFHALLVVDKLSYQHDVTCLSYFELFIKKSKIFLSVLKFDCCIYYISYLCVWNFKVLLAQT